LFTYGPVVVSVDALNPIFKNYRGGIIKDQLCSKQIGHAVLAVGYGYDENVGEFVIIKNSWGERWGEMGFVRISLS
jgi:cathepsin L